jgi:chorismate mutase
VQALRGATTVDRDERGAIIEATGQLLDELMTRNGVAPSDVISIVFTATPDLTSEFPAAAARARGLADVPLLCASEIAVGEAPERCVRLLMHLYSDLERSQLTHVYLRGARRLRSDLGPAPESGGGERTADPGLRRR